jgi:hypothetical protein
MLLWTTSVTNLHGTTKQSISICVAQQHSPSIQEYGTHTLLRQTNKHHLTPATARDPRQLAFLSEKAFGPITNAWQPK